ncbi:unnamed protein product, partial [Ectocarpus sp. 12 AP-2014]
MQQLEQQLNRRRHRDAGGNTSPSRTPPGMKHRSVNVVPALPASPPPSRGAAAAAAAAESPASFPAAALSATAAAGGADPEPAVLAAGSTTTTAAAAAGPSLLDVSFLVASGGWLDLASGKHLQEASGTLCRDCREYVGSHLRVDYSTPRALWPLRTAGFVLFGRGHGGGGRMLGIGNRAAAASGGVGVRRLAAGFNGKENAGGTGCRTGGSSSASGGKGGLLSSRLQQQQQQQQQQQRQYGWKGRSIPPLRVTTMTWERPLSDLAHGRALPPGLHSLHFACSFRYFDVGWVSFPTSLLSLSFGQNFDQGIDSIAWPPSLQRLTFGWEFNQPLDGVQLPPSLKTITFGQSFDQPIDLVSWPLGLEDLTFGGRFHQPIHRVSFPPGLRRLTFGWRFNHPIADVLWPSSLQRLMFGSLFNQ